MSSIGEDFGSTTLAPLTFGGAPNEDVTAFLGAVKRVAVLQGRQRDDQWIVDYVESCLRGDAMRWFDGIGPGATQLEWGPLRRLFLERFKNHNMPPASASAPPAAPPAAMRLLVQPSPLPPLYTAIREQCGEVKTKLRKEIVLGHGWIPSHKPTAGIHHEIEINLLEQKDKLPSVYKFAFWDASGADQYRSMIGPYCAGMTRIWLVYDVTDKKSFENVRTWFDLVRRSWPEGQKTLRLIGNKCDLYDQRVVHEDQGRELAEELGIPQFFETSAKTNEGVPEMWDSWFGGRTKYIR
ncbi:GTP-binding protein [Tulasnella sp. 332]|nr:GTP-binding protein [Tulasnella sp. 332]